MKIAKRWGRARLLVVLIVGCLAPRCIGAQENNNPDASTSDSPQSSTSTTETLSVRGDVNPLRTRQSHSEERGRTVDKRSVERLGPDGRYVPYQDVEQESIRVDATTVRTVQRTFGRGPDGQKTLVQVSEEEARSLPGGEKKVVRSTSNPDVNGRLQTVQREIRETKNAGPGVQETNTTIFNPNMNGGMTPTTLIQERDKKVGAQSVEYRKSISMPDGNGNWQVNEIREGTIREENDKSRSKEERVLRPDADGKFAVMERTVSKEARSANGESRATEESYSTAVPGSSPDGSLHLNQRVTTTSRKTAGGGQVNEQRVEQPNPGQPSEGLRTVQKTTDTVSQSVDGSIRDRRTMESLDANGGMGVVWVDMTKTTKTATVQVDTKKNSPPVQVDTKNAESPK